MAPFSKALEWLRDEHSIQSKSLRLSMYADRYGRILEIGAPRFREPVQFRLAYFDADDWELIGED